MFCSRVNVFLHQLCSFEQVIHIVVLQVYDVKDVGVNYRLKVLVIKYLGTKHSIEWVLYEFLESRGVV